MRSRASVAPVTDDCLFCRIVAGSVPAEEVASTEHTYAFRDIEPAA
ncbi:MAG: HIT family protein, partial [Acidimicrobiales bacterium]